MRNCKINGYRVQIGPNKYRIYSEPYDAPATVTRAQIAAYMDSISDSNISLSISGTTATFTFPAASADIADAIANGIGDGNTITIGVVRNTGKGNRELMGQYDDGTESLDIKKGHGWNYRNWKANWPSDYTFQTGLGTSGSNTPNRYGHKLAISKDAFGNNGSTGKTYDKLTAAELTAGRAVRSLSILNNMA